MKEVPTQGPAFEAMMREIDAELKADGKDITDRPIFAVGEVSIRYDISIPMGGEPERLPPELRPYATLGEAIHRWYEDTYGDRLKVDMCPGRIVVVVDGDLYVLRIPRLFGAVQFVLTREFLAEPGITRGPVTCNVVQLLEGMTAAKAAGLSDASLSAIDVAFGIGLPAAYTLENTDHELMYIARGDVAAAVAALMDQGERYGASKWASLQAAEKVLKTAISLKGAKFKYTHGLKELCKHLSDLGITLGRRDLIAEIQCSPKIRYGEEPCTRDQALAAHQASLELVNQLREAGAGFEIGLG